MNRLLLALGTAALVLSAPPVAAKESRNAAALDAHFDSLNSADGDACFEFDALDPPTREKHCADAIAALEANRAATRNPSVGQTANFDYQLVTLQAGLGASYAQQDGTLSARACKLLESNLAIRARLKLVPESELSASMYDTFQNPPSNFASLIAQCRKSYGTPPGAPALPA